MTEARKIPWKRLTVEAVAIVASDLANRIGSFGMPVYEWIIDALMVVKKHEDILQITGVLGVIASLVFVGLEIRQSHKIARADIYQSSHRIPRHEGGADLSR